MQGASGGLAAQLVGEPVAQAEAPVPTEAATRGEWLAQPSHQLLGEQRIQDFLVITFCAAFSLIGWLMIAQGAEQLRAARALMQWPVAYGVIEATEVYPVEGSQGARWRPHVTYSYAVGSRVVTATRLSLGKAPLEAQRQDAERFLSRFRPGSPVLVFFNPRELTESVLDVSPAASVYVNLAFGAALALGGPALLVLFGFWPRHRTAAAAAGGA